jgi:hypothetical protein
MVVPLYIQSILKNKKFIVIFIAIVFILSTSVAGVFLYKKHRSGDDMVMRVGKLMVLPDETPSIATVSDKSQLVNQSFFENSENGDVVLIYAKARIAILYSPKINKIVKVGPVNYSQSSPVSPIKVALYNGTSINGLATKYQDMIMSDVPNSEVTLKKNAINDYDKNIVIDLTGKNKGETQAIAESINGEVGSLPEGEEKPLNVDILVILGKKI